MASLSFETTSLFQPVSFHPVSWILKPQTDEEISFYLSDNILWRRSLLVLMSLKWGALLSTVIPRNIATVDGDHQPGADQSDQQHLR